LGEALEALEAIRKPYLIRWVTPRRVRIYYSDPETFKIALLLVIRGLWRDGRLPLNKATELSKEVEKAKDLNEVTRLARKIEKEVGWLMIEWEPY